MVDRRAAPTIDSGTVYGPWPTRKMPPGGEITICADPTGAPAVGGSGTVGAGDCGVGAVGGGTCGGAAVGGAVDVGVAAAGAGGGVWGVAGCACVGAGV